MFWKTTSEVMLNILEDEGHSTVSSNPQRTITSEQTEVAFVDD